MGATAVKRIVPADIIELLFLLLGCLRVVFFRKINSSSGFGSPFREEHMLNLECHLIERVDVALVVPKVALD